MAYDEALGDRLRSCLKGRRDIVEKKMFGGIAYMHRGHMFIGIVKHDLMVRVGPNQHDDAVKKPHARVMDFTGKPMKGYIYVNPDGTQTDADIKKWIDMALVFNKSMPAK